MVKSVLSALVLLVAMASVPVNGQYKTVSAAGPSPNILPVTAVREGMRGTARSVFRGAQPEEFAVEILGVLPNWIGPKQDLIVGRLSGANAERTFVFAGMSGSPVYIDGKLVGAISYSFPFAKEPICGITPFEQMASVMEQAPQPKLARQTRTYSYSELSSDLWSPALGGINSGIASGFAADSAMMAVAGQTFKPIATPVTISGISQKVIDMFGPSLREAGILPVAAPGGGAAITPLKPTTETTLRGGDSVVVGLSRGDIQMAAAGTVTLRDGNKIYAFGHPLLSLGSTSLPMMESHVVTVVPNANNSFKLAVADSLVGTLTQDRNTAIYGLLGEAPKMLPVKIRLTTSRGTVLETNFETVVDETLTPLIVNAGVANALAASERSFGESTIELDSVIRVKGNEPIHLKRRFANAQAMGFASTITSVPLNALLRGGFPDLEINDVTIDLKATDGSEKAVLDRLTIDRSQARAGDTVQVSVFERTESGRIAVQRVPVEIPKDAAPGTVSITVGDGNAVQQTSGISQFTPTSPAEFISIYNRLKRGDRLYAVLAKSTQGTIIGTSEMPNLPPSMLATINNDRSVGGTKTAVQTVMAETELPVTVYIVSGSQTINIEIVR